MRAILYTTKAGGVAVCHPAPECVRLLQGGGAFGKLARGSVDALIEREIARGAQPDMAKRWITALAFGGGTEAEAWGLIRDRDCAPHGSAFEAIDPHGLPSRTFRDAWRRGHNGGPIAIDLKAAKSIQFKRIKAAVDRHNARAESEMYGPGLITPRWGSIRDALHNAQCIEAIARVGIDLNLGERV